MQRFVYTALELGYIRVLHILPRSTPDGILCSLELRKQEDVDVQSALRGHTHPSDVPPDKRYAALSYCWGE